MKVKYDHGRHLNAVCGRFQDIRRSCNGTLGPNFRSILAQLQACKDGGFTDDELEWARRSVVSTLMTTLDAQSRLEDYWLGQAAAGLTEAPDELAQRVERTTRAQVQAAAQKLTLDTVYFLKGKE